MKKYLVLLLTLLVSTFSLNSFAFTAPPKPTDNTYVLDQAGKLDAAQVSKLNAKIEALNKSTKNEYAIVLLKTLDGAAIEDAAQDTFRSWGVGKANLNNGVMIMIATGERKTRIQTGKNAEGDLPDLLCNDILNNNLKPYLKKGDFYGGLDATLNAVSSHMESREKEKAVVAAPKETPNAAPADVAATSQNNSGSGAGGILLVLLLGGAGIVGLIAFFSYRANKRRQEEEERDRVRQEVFANLERARIAEQRKADQRAREVKAKLTPVVLPVPSHEPLKSTSTVSSTTSHATRNVAVGAAVLGAAALASAAVANKRDEDSARRQREESARRRREEEDAARRRREEDEAASRRRSEESSNSSWSSSSSSSSSSWDSGGSSGFGGGDSGGGGSSGDY